jgi:hypothetical protein
MGIEVDGRDNLVEGNEVWGTIQYHPNWHNPPSWVDADGMKFFGSGHINQEKPSTWVVFGLEIHIETPAIFISKNRPVAKMGQHGRISALDGG